MRIVIIGAGQNGCQVANIIKFEREMELVGFLDDNATLHGGRLCGRPILGGTDLMYACIAKVESIPLVTRDSNFLLYGDEIVIVNPVTGLNTREA